ncbi:condensation domain-containing protein, partial [Streptomyces humi]|uniref:condensation domain-containing protein n=1 Tax=Streptomyces humi TaxID=1428620 RepID=UPI001160D292
VHVTVAQLFDHQTVAGLASVAAGENGTDAEQGLVVGEFPLTPIQRWFLERDLPEAWHFNQSTVLEVAGDPDPEALRTALRAVVEQHDVLRSRFVREEGRWAGRVVPAEPADLLTVIDAAGADEAFLDARATQVQASLDLGAGPLLRAALFERGEQGRLLLVAVHHLVVDAVSWPVLLEDLASAYEQAAGGDSVVLPPKTTSFMRWAERLSELAGTPELAEEAAYWRRTETAATALPRELSGANAVDLARRVDVVLGAEDTERLLREVPQAFRTQINDVLLSALGVVLTEWCDAPSVVVDVEGHGREDVGADVDVSRTVGWFTSVYPVALSGLADGDLGDLLRRTKEYLRAVPRKGLGYGLLRHLTDWTPEPGRPGAEVSFNYLGQSGGPGPHREGDDNARRFRPSGRSFGADQSSQGERAHLIEVNCQIADGVLEMSWTYGGEVHGEATVRRLARRYIEVLTDLIAYCCRPDVGGHTPSDFPLARLDQTAVDVVARHVTTVIDDVYPLTALQQGMLFHTHLSADPGMYWVQNGLVLDGDLDLDALRRAWELVFSRHEILRSTVVWDGVPEPLAVVSRSVPLPLSLLDLSHLEADAQQRAIEDHLAEDWQRGADFSAPTLVRLTLLRLAEDRHQLVWSYHHLLLDGWSVPIVLGEMLAAYQAFRAGERPQLPARAPFRDFVGWVAGQDLDEARGYWAGRLAGFTEPTSPGAERDTGEQGQQDVHLELPDPVAGAALAEFARRHRLTLNTVVQGAWALVLALHAGSDDVVFGATSSGRGGQIDGMDDMVGLLLNTTPVRIRIDRDQPVADWLTGLQDEQVRARRYEHTPLATITAWSEVPSGQALFDTLFVFENYPDETLAQGRELSAANGLATGLNHVRQQASYPLSLTAGSGRHLMIKLSYDRSRFDADTVQRLGRHLVTVLGAVAEDAGQRRVGELPVLSADEHEQLVRGWNGAPDVLPSVGGVHELIAGWAADTPDTVAVVSGGQALTYGGLLTRANRLAHELRGRGVGAESVVGLCLPRGVDMVVAVLGVWLAGGAYLPLDPDYPAERLEFMVADSGAQVVLREGDLAQT